MKKVTVGRERVTLIFSKVGLLNLLGLDLSATQSESDDYRIDLTVKLQRCGIESKLIVAGKHPGSAHLRTIGAIQNAMNLALRWNQELVSGQANSMKALATRHGVT